ncbi:MAG: hypothetical protein ABR502_02300 [Chitinophagaceae bacterium]
MVKYIYILLAISCAAFTCNKDNIEDCKPESFEHFFQASKTIDTIRSVQNNSTIEQYQYEIKEGNNLVFKYIHHFRDCPQIADDEGNITIVFEVPPATNHFRIEDSIELRKAKTIIAYNCFCGYRGPSIVKKGWIEGHIVNTNKWRIKANLNHPGSSDAILVDKEFVLQ